ncbi:MAG: phosphoribosylglycinamide formyltransferase [Clostridia bacterium]
MKNIAIFASGSGSDMQSVVDACESGKIDGKICVLIASREGIFALERAKAHQIPCKVFDKNNYDSMQLLDKAIVDYLKAFNIDLIVLAGYLNIITPVLVQNYEGKMINIHPSLIPQYCGKGFYGMRVHNAVIANHEKFSGCTVHYVDCVTDTGKIIKQTKVEVLPDDTAETLQKRVLEQEHILLPQVVAELCKN